MAAHYDVLIVGGGIAGLSLASALAGSCSVALVEAEQELAYHTSSRSARQLIPSYGPDVVRELTVRTLELIAARDAQLPEPVLTPRSFMLIGTEESVRAEGSGHMNAITHDRALKLCPALVPGTFSAAGLDTGSFACNAPLLLEDHRQRAEAAGADIITGARVHSAQRLGSGWEIGAGQEAFEAGVLVNAAGAWADELAVISGVEKLGLQPYRRTAAIVDVEHPVPGHSPMVAAADHTFYFRREGTDVLISPSESVPSGPEDARPRPGDVERLIVKLNQLTTLGIRGVRRAWTGLRTEVADGVPVAGFDAEAPGFYWLAGQGGYGFQTSSAMAELAAAQILAGQGTGHSTVADHHPASRTAEALAATRWSIRR
ncbi:FAD-dependent oxidoreductase [Pseudarthrobacter sp. AL07]|uniref:NAD(P)/FAD-dependent oxidoreductase n=1 Tax=unclassified Pseudarthrobacter TaxID=2647000 RepID=UPI00249B5A16|nr:MULTISPECIES: FAD-dependent oxidoreductase [unclassified Pseudarthrobacter]MDI3193369.1 FAD-dependent oxidoreductase [Pseudarthrobacter sp. AL20]MDI3207437.1 FAD-dependent oxidoreductase [Pseudarthrobacter sp. AL07]